MRRWQTCLVVALLLLIVTAGAYAQFQGPRQFSQTVSATQTNTAISFGFLASWALVINDGPSTVYVNFGGTTATTSDFALLSGEFVGPNLANKSEGLGLITAAATTASVRVLALQ